MKKIFLSLFLISLSFFAFAESVLLKNIFPQNYANLTELTGDKAASVVSSCKNLVDSAVEKSKLGKDFSFTRVFSQKNQGKKIYRILVTSVDLEKLDFPTLESGTYSENDFHWLQSRDHAILQLVVEQNPSGYTLVDYDVTGLWRTDNSGTTIYFSDFIVSSDEDSRKHMHLKAQVPVSIGSTWDGLTKATFMTRGTSLFGTQSAEFTIEEGDSKSTIKIVASDFLADRLSPLKYSLLSAFDKNPKTCYKENSAGNTISMQVSFSMDMAWTKKHGKVRVTQASIINGDSASGNDYFATDRIGTITTEAWNNERDPGSKETMSFTLKDYNLESQTVFLPASEGKNYFVFSTSEIIKGNRHDLSISEFNLKLSGTGWIF